MKKIIGICSALVLFVVLLVVGTTRDVSSIPQLFTSLIDFDSNAINEVIWIQIRLPRLLLAFFTGAALGLSGYLMQVLVRNPLADPYVLGSSSGASLFAAIFYIWFAPASTSLFFLLLLTFIGAFATNMLSIALATVKGRIIPYRMILVGISISSLAIAVLSLLLYTSGEDQSWKNIIFWTFGSFQTASWWKVGTIALVSFPLLMLSFILFGPFQILELGEENANRLGVSVQKYRLILVLISSMLTAVAVSMAGPIGFLGLIMPHMVRIFYKFELTKSFVLWLCFFSGIFLMSCEILSSIVFPPQGIPAGILMSLIGVPFFLYVLLNSNAKNI